jgi:carboxyl-terminal processing protease
MKKIFIFIVLLLFLVITVVNSGAKEYSTAELASMIVKTSERYHYKPRSLNDSLSKQIYESLIKKLDPHGCILTSEIINRLGTHKYSIDDQIKQMKTTFLDTITFVYEKQLHIVDSIIDDFRKNTYTLTSADTLWLGDSTIYVKQAAFRKKWDLWMKYMILWSYLLKRDSLKTEIIPTAEKTKEIFNDVIGWEKCKIKLKTNISGGIKGYTRKLYLTAIANAYDPHTNYLSEEERIQRIDNLSKSSGSFGIHIDMNFLGEIEITGITPGSAAWNSNKINEGDIILSIKKTDGSSIDLKCINYSYLNNFISSIDHKQAVFRIRKKNGNIVLVNLKKQMLDVEENTIRSYVLKGNLSTGYVYLPSFYTDYYYGEYASKGCASDLAKELIKLKKENINGLILDLRSNGGGVLSEAIRMAGSFIDNGAMCITHERGNNPEIAKDIARGTVFSGPLVILVDASSASASELLAGTLQDYNRALIIGSKTFGKSTMQSTIPVDAGKYDSLSLYKGVPIGFLSITMGCFYRVTGTSHQNTGIIPDIVLPGIFENMLRKESVLNNTLFLEPIKKKTYYQPASALPIEDLKRLSAMRIKKSREFNYILRNKSFLPTPDSRYSIPLDFKSFVVYMGRITDSDDSLKTNDSLFSVKNPSYLTDNNSMSELEKNENDKIMNSIKSDIYINEAYNILNDLMVKSTPVEKK